MMTAEQKEEIEYIRDCVLAKFPLLGVAMADVETFDSDSVDTACTDGKNVFYSPKFFETLSEDEKIFTYAHEVLHIAFEHVFRSQGKDSNVWNIATDAVINQMLLKEGLPIKEGLVDMPEADGHSAEEMYVILMKRQKEKQQKQQEEEKQQKQQETSGQSQEQQQNQQQRTSQQQEQQKESQSQQNSDEMPDFNVSNHDIWKEAVERQMEQQQKSQKHYLPRGAEKDFSERNQKEQEKQEAEIARELERQSREAMGRFQGIRFGEAELGDQPEVALNWKKLLQKFILEDEDAWSYRRADAENDYSARLEEVEREEGVTTEVMLDVSGSVNHGMLKEFLRQLKPLLKVSKLKVGFFDHRAFPFQEIKTVQDINELLIPGGGYTDIDLAVRSFSKGKDINRIVFTDGAGDMPQPDLDGVKPIWIIYDNPSFQPRTGKVVYVDSNEIYARERFDDVYMMSRIKDR